MVTCTHCRSKQSCSKKLSIYRWPPILIIHIKRFRYSSLSSSQVQREKLHTDVNFPISNFDLTPFLSSDRCHQLPSVVPGSPVVGPSITLLTSLHSKDSYLCPSFRSSSDVETGKTAGASIHLDLKPLYQLIGVSNHNGNLSEGHYVAHINTNAQQDPNSPRLNLLSHPIATSQEARWMCFNDQSVSSAHPHHIAGPSAYVLFYRLQP